MNCEQVIEPPKLVEFLSRSTDPRFLVGPIIFGAALRGTADILEAAFWTFAILVLSVLPVLVLIAFQTKRGAFVDQQVPHRRLRNQVYIVGIACLIFCLLILMVLPAPKSLVALLSAMLASGIIASSLNLRWKVSVHTGAVAGAAVSLVALFGPLALPTLALVPIVGWTRLALHRHTLGEVISGGLVGGGITALVFWLMAPLLSS
jgi:membrane-associated phospholipid phosphatase